MGVQQDVEKNSTTITVLLRMSLPLFLVHHPLPQTLGSVEKSLVFVFTNLEPTKLIYMTFVGLLNPKFFQNFTENCIFVSKIYFILPIGFNDSQNIYLFVKNVCISQF